MIVNDTSLGSFVVDYSNFHIMVSFQKQNTIYAVSLDGKESTNLRTKVTQSKFQKVISLAYANRKFFWTDGRKVFNEEYHRAHDSYFHNSYPSSQNYKKIFINLPSSQPTPAPVNPPTNVQAIFGCNIAKIKWQAPHLLGVQSKQLLKINLYHLYINLFFLRYKRRLAKLVIRNISNRISHEQNKNFQKYSTYFIHSNESYRKY